MATTTDDGRDDVDRAAADRDGGDGWRGTAQRITGRIKDDRIGLIAAGVAFKAFLSLIPILIAGISIYGLVVDPQTVTDQIQQLARNLPESAAGVIEQQATQIAESTSSTLGIALALSLAAALWSASGGVAGLISGLNAAYDVEDSRGFVGKRALAIALAIGAIVLGALLVAGLAVLPVVLGAVDLGGAAEQLIQVGRWFAIAVIVAVALAGVYRLGPNRPAPSMGTEVPGAVVGTVVWLLGTAVFAVLVRTFGSFNETYGSLAGVIVLMLWLYLSSFAVLLGGYVNAEREGR